MSIVRDVLMWVFFSVPVGLVVAALVAMMNDRRKVDDEDETRRRYRSFGNYIFYYLDKREGVIYLVFVRSRDSLASLLK